MTDITRGAQFDKFFIILADDHHFAFFPKLFVTEIPESRKKKFYPECNIGKELRQSKGFSGSSAIPEV